MENFVNGVFVAPEAWCALRTSGLSCYPSAMLALAIRHQQPIERRSTPWRDLREASVDVGQALRQLGDIPERRIAVCAEYVGEIDGTLPVDGQAEEVNALQPRFRNRLARIFDTVRALIGVLIVGLAIREQQQQPEA